MSLSSPETRFDLVLSCPPGVESLLLKEVEDLIQVKAKETPRAVLLSATIKEAYTLCLWSRLASRVLVKVAEGMADSAQDLYEVARSVNWVSHFSPHQSFRVDFNGTSREIKNSQFGGLKVKDAIVDYFYGKTGTRPSVSKDEPDLRIHCFLKKGQLQLFINISGESLHRRGYRQEAGLAPMKENLAAAVLIRAGWFNPTSNNAALDESSQTQWDQLIDPMCGSGTLLIEAAMMQADVAPALMRKQFGFEYWRQHDAQAWLDLKEEAKERAAAGKEQLKAIFFGCDQDKRVIQRAKDNARRAGMIDYISFSVQSFENLTPPKCNQGLLVSNPPYGERLEEKHDVAKLYVALGQLCLERLEGYHAAIYAGNWELAKGLPWVPYKQYKLRNGSIDTRLLLFRLLKEKALKSMLKDNTDGANEGAQMVANRIKKNQKRLKPWLKQQDIMCYRVYDADLPEYSVAVDVYDDHVQVAEYAPPKSIPLHKAQQRLADAIDGVKLAFDLPEERLHIKQRARQTGVKQYNRMDEQGNSFVVKEGELNIQVNLTDYLDTGLFLDHRPIRRWIGKHAQGKSFLNLFCYTGVASLHAAAGGAQDTTSVDMSATYLNWAGENFKLNDLNSELNRFVRADCMQWLQQQADKSAPQGFDIIFMDPPSFSNSKKMEGVLDIQRDHSQMIQHAMTLLKPDGLLIFSNNLRSFKLDEDALQDYAFKEVSQWTVPKDFERRKNIHKCWFICHSSESLKNFK